jgi:hypothetical protein
VIPIDFLKNLLIPIRSDLISTQPNDEQEQDRLDLVSAYLTYGGNAKITNDSRAITSI